jgi:hypothetical protein
MTDRQGYISHTPSTGVLSLSFAAPPQSRDDSGAEDTMLYPSVLPLPTYMFNSMPTGARVHTTFLPALETHGAAALRAVRDVPAANIEVSGHGRGAAIALLVAAALRRRLDVPITATLFGLPRVGNAAFARWVDELGPEGGHAPFVLRRVNSRNEVAVPGLVHPRAIAEVVMGTDGAARCVPTVEEEESAVCAAGETSLGGPYGSVRIHRECA